MKGDEATVLYDQFNMELSKYLNVQKGIFGAYMQVTIENDGPTTIILEK